MVAPCRTPFIVHNKFYKYTQKLSYKEMLSYTELVVSSLWTLVGDGFVRKVVRKETWL